MACLMGIDLGTSSVKTLLMEEDGKVLACCGESYEIEVPQTGYAEQDPDMWYEKTIATIRSVLGKSGIPPEEIRGISFSGQMHGLVCVDRQGRPLRKAIIWSDQRSKASIGHIYEKLGSGYVTEQTQNRISTGFLLSSLFWLYENEKETYDSIWRVMLPKDYVKYRMTGRIITDYSDAAGSLAFDNVHLRWAAEMLEKLGLNPEIFPECDVSSRAIGTICRETQERTGLSASVRVVNGGADQCMQGIGNGIVEDGIFASNIGTGGQISTCCDRPLYDPLLRTNTFAHAISGRWNIYGAALSSRLSLNWLTKKITKELDYRELDRKCEAIPAGSEGLIFLPSLSGARTPHQNPDAKGVFFGLNLKHDSSHMARAVMEGVVFSLKDCLDAITGIGVTCGTIVAAGGGARSRLWLQMQADIFEKDIRRTASAEQACLGAAITAGVGTGVYGDFAQAGRRLVRFDDEVFRPNERNVRIYREYLAVYRELYRANEALFTRLSRIRESEMPGNGCGTRHEAELA